MWLRKRILLRQSILRFGAMRICSPNRRRNPLRDTATLLMGTRFNCRDRCLTGAGVASDADQLGKIEDRRKRNN